MDNEVTLQDILSALGGPLEETSLWALLSQSCSLLENELRDVSHTIDPDLLITPESMLLYRGGIVQFLRGIADAKSNFLAPELRNKTHHLGKEELEKIYVYSLGTTLFTAMQFELDEGQTPHVSDDINNILVAMVDDDAQERKSLSEIGSLCQKRISQEASTAEVDRLVSYILGTEAELSLSDATDLDDANLEAEFQEAMNIPPTGSVEHLYSPSYGSRTSSSLSIHSLQRHASFKSQDSVNQQIQFQYSSMPLVYFSSQDRLNKPPLSHHGPASENAWSSFDRLTSPLQSHEVDLLASKAKVGGGTVQLTTSSHPRYMSHIYTPTRARKPAHKNVKRSESFESQAPDFFRTSSDGTRAQDKSATSKSLPQKITSRNESAVSKKGDMALNVQSQAEPAVVEKTSPVENIQPSVNAFSLEDMPTLPPPYATPGDMSMDSPIKHVEYSATPPVVPSSVEKIDSILQSVERRKSDEELESAPPPLPPSEPPMFTPYKRDGAHSPVPSSPPPAPDTPHTNTSFDYSELGSPPHSPLDTSKVENDDFEFASPPPIPISSPPQDAGEGDTPTKQFDQETAVVAEVEPLESAHVPGNEAWTVKGNDKNIDRTITPRRALVEAFKDLDKIGESTLDSDDQDTTDEQTFGVLDVDALYAKVDMSKKTRKTGHDKVGAPISKDDMANESKDPLENTSDNLEGDPDLSALYAKVDMSKKTRRNPNVVGVAEDDIENGPVVTPLAETDLVQTNTAETNTTQQDRKDPPRDPAYEEIDIQTTRSGQSGQEAPGSRSKSSLADPGYATIQEVFQRPTSGDYSEVHTNVTLESKGDRVRKASSEANVTEVEFAVVHHPKRSSMPPGSMPGSESDYEPVKPLPSKRSKTLPPHSTNERLYEITTENGLKRNKASLKKLQTVFGPEFAKISGGPSQPVKQKGSVARSNSVLVVPEGRRVVTVVLLNAKSVQFVVECDSTCDDLFQQVVSHQSLQEKRIFGLAIIEDRDEVFLEFDRKLSKYAPTGWTTTSVPLPGSHSHRPPVFTVFFRVKYYVENVIELRLSQTRHQLYMQLRKDILEGKMFCHEQSALKLAAHALQAERGDYSAMNKNQAYFKLEDYMPKRASDKLGHTKSEQLLTDIHAEQQGKTREEAELNFLKEAQTLPEYGVVFYRVSQDKHTPLGSKWLGFCIRGIVVYDVHKDVKTPTTHCPWRSTQNLSFSNRKFIVEQVDTKPLVFYTQSYRRARYLLRLSISYHRFQLVSRGLLPKELSDQSKPPTPKLDLATTGSPTGSPTKGSFHASPPDNKPRSGDHTPKSRDPHVHEVKILKEMGKGLGLNIASWSSPDGVSCVVINSIEKDGPAYMDGRLKKGDILLSVDGQEVDGLGHKQVGDILKNSSDLVKITVHRSPKLPTPILLPDTTKNVFVEIEKNQTLPDTTKSVVVEIEDDQTPIPDTTRTPSPSASSSSGAKRQLKRATTLELQSTPKTGKLPNAFSLSQAEQRVVTIKKGENGSFGFAIASGEFDGVIILKVTPGGPAEKAVLKPADKILTINSVKIKDKSYNEVLKLIQQSNDVLNLGVSRRAPSPWSDIENLPPGTSFVVELEKRQGSLGLRIAGGKNKPFGFGFIYVKTITEGSAAHVNRLEKNDILLQVNNDKMAGVTHREAAGVIMNSGERVLLHIHRPHNSSWVDQSGDIQHPKGLTREESSSSIYLPDTHSLPLQASPKDLSSIQEAPEIQPSFDQAIRQESQAETETVTITDLDTENVSEEMAGEVENELELVVEVIPPELPAEGPPLDDSLFQDEYSSDVYSSSIPLLPSTDLLGSTSEPQLLSGVERLAVEGVSEVKSESFLLDTTAATVDDEEGRVTVVLRKGFRGLGFTLDKAKSGQPGRGVFVLSVDNDPAKSDGTIQPGDEIIQVNDDSVVSHSHREAINILRQAEKQVSLVIRREPDISEDEEEEEWNEPPPVLPLSPLPQEEPPIEITEIETLVDHQDEMPLGREVLHTSVEDSYNSDSLGDTERNAELVQYFDHELEGRELQLNPNEQLTPEKQPFEPDPPLGPLPDDDNAVASPLSLQPPFTSKEPGLSASSPPETDGEEDQGPSLPQTPPPENRDEGLPMAPSPATASSDSDDEETPPPLTSLSPVPDDQTFQDSSKSSSPLNSLTNLPVDLELDQPAVDTPTLPLEDDEDVSEFEDDISLPMELRLDDSDSINYLQPDHLEDAPPIPYTPPPADANLADLADLTISEEQLSPTHI